ncbi:MAG TPA: hypothetical protein ENI11_00515 [Actinobacteria bacterium]|nr:hypothetical protein [Actinomycetota bacterium]
MKKVAFFLTMTLFLALFATAAQAQGDWSAPKHYYRKGKIVAIDKNASSVTFLSQKRRRTVFVDAKTRIKKNGAEASFAELALADRGIFKYEKTDWGQLSAIKIFVDTPFTTGKISKITPDTVRLKHRRKARNFKIDSTTIYRNWKEVDLSELRVGDQAKIFYNKLEAGGLVALKIKATGPAVRYYRRQGKIVTIDAANHIIKFLPKKRMGRRKLALKITDNTWIKKNGRTATFAKLALADRGTVKYFKTKNKKLRALKVFVKTPFTTGKIGSTTTDTVTLKHRRKSRVFKIKQTKIRRNGRNVHLPDLKRGDWAKIFYNRLSEGGLWARRIKASGAK